jgi:malate synthase
MESHAIQGVEIKGSNFAKFAKILTPEALEFIANLHYKFNNQRLELLKKRQERQKLLNQGVFPSFPKETETIRKDSHWKTASTPDDLQQRWVEITGPTDRKMIINAMNSGADIFMADFEDANSPTWDNMLEGQVNLKDTVEGTISFESPDGKQYELNDNPSVLMVRPRGWHLNEKHLVIHGEEVSGSLFDFGLYFFHNAKKLLSKGSGPYFYLPKLESSYEARLWNDVFTYSQKSLGIPQSSIRATVLLETVLAAFEMEEILFELKEHSAGLNAGRWDYIFSIIKKFRRDPNLHLPDRDQITMTVPFMRAYTELLIKTCHHRGAHVLGGMAAFIPNRKDPEVTEKALRKVREDKLREVGDGFDGTWVAHPDLVPIARKIFETSLKGKPHQKDRMRDEVKASAQDLLNFTIPGGTITENGLRHNINVAIQYLASWLSGRGAVAIYNLMEDAATAEISRAQVWQWINNKEVLDDGREINKKLVKGFIVEEMQMISELYGKQFNSKTFTVAKTLFENLVFAEHFIEFLTLPAYEKLD